jgi:hypothetical protein
MQRARCMWGGRWRGGRGGAVSVAGTGVGEVGAGSVGASAQCVGQCIGEGGRGGRMGRIRCRSGDLGRGAVGGPEGMDGGELFASASAVWEEEARGVGQVWGRSGRHLGRGV